MFNCCVSEPKSKAHTKLGTDKFFNAGRKRCRSTQGSKGQAGEACRRANMAARFRKALEGILTIDLVGTRLKKSTQAIIVLQHKKVLQSCTCSSSEGKKLIGLNISVTMFS